MGADMYYLIEATRSRGDIQHTHEEQALAFLADAGARAAAGWRRRPLKTAEMAPRGRAVTYNSQPTRIGVVSDR